MPWFIKMEGVDGEFSDADRFDFSQLTTEPTAPGEDVMCQNNLRIGDSFSFTDYKPTESLKADDNFLVINWLAEDHFKVDPSDPSVDPTNPNVEWPIGPIPEVQDDGLLLPY